MSVYADSSLLISYYIADSNSPSAQAVVDEKRALAVDGEAPRQGARVASRWRSLWYWPSKYESL
jgi:hypothetical protein